jgi:predicted Zn-dependent peptidase
LTLLPAVQPGLRTTSFCLTVTCGSRSDPDGFGGLTHLVEHLVMSAPLRGGESFSRRAERMGGTVNAHTGLEEQQFYAQVHADDAPEVLDLLLEAAFSLDTGEATVEREKDVVLQELAGGAADPSEQAQDAILEALFPGHPLGAPVGGTPEGIRAIRPEHVRAHHTGAVLTRPVSLSVVGPQIPELPGDVIANLAGDRLPDDRTPLTPVRRDPITWPRGYFWLCFGVRSPAMGDPARPAYDLLALLLDSSPASLLYRRLRDEHALGYAFDTWDRGYTEAGAWRMLVGVDDGNGDRVEQIARGLLAELADGGPEDEDLRTAKRRAEVQLLLQTENPLELAKLAGVRSRAGGVPWSADADLAALTAVPAGAIAEAAADVLANLTTVVRAGG